MTDGSVQPDGEPVGSTSTTWLYRVRELEPQAWQTFVHLYGPLVYHWCRRAGLQEADAADVGQEVFRAVLGAISRFRREKNGSFRCWLRTITRNKVRDFGRERSRVPGEAVGGDGSDQLNDLATLTASADEAPDPDEERILYRQAIELVLADYKDETRQAFVRVVLDRQDPTAVAADLGLSLNAVYLAKSRILRRLREDFADLIEPGPE